LGFTSTPRGVFWEKDNFNITILSSKKSAYGHGVGNSIKHVDMPNDLTQIATLPGQTQGTARVGAELRAVRERLGWKLADVSASLRIRLPFLEAIERGDLGALPGAAYQTGFIRTYAQALGLDPEEILRRFRAEGMDTAAKAELSFPAPVPDRAVPTGAIVLLGVVLVLVGYGLWYRHTEEQRLAAEAVPAIPAELAPLALPKPVIPPAQVVKPAPVDVEPAPAAAVPASPAAVPGNVAAEPAATAPAPVAPAVPAAAVPAMPAVTAPAATPAAPTQTPPPAASQVAAPATVPPVAPLNQITPVPPALPASAGSIVATADSWVEVQDSTGNILFSRVLHAGESWPIPDVPGLILTSGNAGGTAITQNGKTGPALGSLGVVLHNYPLTPSAPKATN
jgi:cytoskeleton protein RodZ